MPVPQLNTSGIDIVNPLMKAQQFGMRAQQMGINRQQSTLNDIMIKRQQQQLADMPEDRQYLLQQRLQKENESLVEYMSQNIDKFKFENLDEDIKRVQQIYPNAAKGFQDKGKDHYINQSEKTGIPANKLWEADKEKFRTLSDQLAQRNADAASMRASGVKSPLALKQARETYRINQENKKFKPDKTLKRIREEKAIEADEMTRAMSSREEKRTEEVNKRKTMVQKDYDRIKSENSGMKATFEEYLESTRKKPGELTENEVMRLMNIEAFDKGLSYSDFVSRYAELVDEEGESRIDAMAQTLKEMNSLSTNNQTSDAAPTPQELNTLSREERRNAYKSRWGE